MALDDQDLYLDLSKFHAQMLTTRGSFMLVFQSMLLSTVAILHGRAPTFAAQPVLLVLGLVTALIWLYMNYLTRLAEVAVWSKLVAIDSRIQEIANARAGKGSISWLMSYPFPVLLALAWGAIMYL